jgi:two-component system, sporulation sensor kinase E
LEDNQIDLMQSHTLDALVEFASGVAHEIRNPLANISSLAQLSLKAYCGNPAGQEHLKSIISSTEHADQIIKELLDFARPQEIPVDCGNINAIIESACNHARLLIRNKSILLIKNFSALLPEIPVDEFQLEKAILNLISNGIQAMEPGGTLTLETDLSDSHLMISVQDTGKGIPIQTIDKIFNPFFTMRSDGVGLGLSLVHKTVDYHQGSIEVASILGKGTRFIIKIQLKRSICISEITALPDD